jgi:hypothetical protein
MTDFMYFKTDEESNKFNLRTLLFITVIFVFIWVMNLLGIFINDTQLFWKTGLSIAPIILAACLYFAIAGYGRPEGKYVILIALILAINTTYVFLTYHIILVLLFPLISAALYRSRKILLITYGINVAAVFVSTPLSYRRRESNTYRFSRADLRRYFVAALENTEVFPAGCVSSQPKSAP